ncbi:MAG: hydroxyacylglutathione hydrolase [Paracoccaceae bacterium]|jgi:hydroxyacylglutathione hydrolase
MSLKLLIVPCLKDNFAYLLHNEVNGETALIDAPEAAPILRALSTQGWQLSDILLTHHHSDHIDAVPELLAAYASKTLPRMVGAKADAHRLPSLDLALANDESFTLCGEACRVMDVSGHTVGHIAFYLPKSGLAFTGDSLMAMGCGRLFEGSFDQMWGSLSRLTALPNETRILSGHDYMAVNEHFALSVEPNNPHSALRATAHRTAGAPDFKALHTTLANERLTNPFLRAVEPTMKAALGLENQTDGAVFAVLRDMRNKF